MKKYFKTLLYLVIFIFLAQFAFAYNVVKLSPGYYPNTSRGRPLSNAYIYVGVQDLDPTVVANQKTLSVQQEDGTIVAVAQPLRTNSGGVPQYLGSPVTLLVDGDYSLAVLDSNGIQIYYVPSTPYKQYIVAGNYYWPDYSEGDQGIAGPGGNTVTDILTTVGATEDATIYFSHNSGSDTTTYTFTTNTVITDNYSILVEQGVIFNGAGTLTVKGLINVPRQEFIGTATLALHADSLQRFVYPEWWGIDGTNDEVQIQKAITCMATASNASVHSAGVVDLDAKRYITNAAITIVSHSISLAGKGRSTVLNRTNGGNYDSITVAPTDTVNSQVYESIIKDLKIQCTGTAMTGGALLKYKSVHGFQLRNVYLEDGFTNLEIVGSIGGRISQLKSYFGALLGAETVGTYHIYIDKGDHAIVPDTSEVYFDVFELNGGTGYYPQVGIAVRNADGIWFSDGHVHRVFGHDLWIDPDTTKSIQGVFFDNVFFDTSGKEDFTGDKVAVTGATTGSIAMIEFVNCQMGTSLGATRGNRGIVVSNPDLTNFTVTGCNIYGNYSHGIYINAVCDQFMIDGNRVVNNNKGDIGSSGIVVIAGNDEFSISNNMIGTDTDTFPMAAGIIAGTGAGASSFVVNENIITNCATNIQTVLVAGGDCVIKNNIPYNTQLVGVVTIDPTADAANINSNGGAVTATLNDGVFIGQMKTIVMSEATAASTVSVTNHRVSDPEVGLFDAVDEVWQLLWTGTEWETIGTPTCTF